MNVDNIYPIRPKNKLAIARKLKARYKLNIEFFKKRIEIQNKPDFNPVNPISGASIRQYSQFDIDVEQDKLDSVNKAIRELK